MDRLTGHGVALHGGSQLGLQPVVRHHVDRHAEHLLQLPPQPRQPEQPDLRTEVHDEIDVAARPVLTARRAAEESDVGGPVLGRDLQHPPPVAAQQPGAVVVGSRVVVQVQVQPRPQRPRRGARASTGPAPAADSYALMTLWVTPARRASSV